MTYHQYGTLKHLIYNDVDIEKAGSLSMVTFGSLIKRGWVKRSGNTLQATQDGIDAYDLYSKAAANYRKHDTGLTDRVRDMLHLNKIRKAV